MSESIAEIKQAARDWFALNQDRFADIEPSEHLKSTLRRVGRERAAADRSAA